MESTPIVSHSQLTHSLFQEDQPLIFTLDEVLRQYNLISMARTKEEKSRANSYIIKFIVRTFI